MTSVKNISKKALLIILDGYGVNPNSKLNAVKDAHTPNLDYYFDTFPFRTIEAGGEKVGLPKGVVGNSEVGHMNLGAGRPVRQDLVRINESIENGTFAELEPLKLLKKAAKNNSNRIHLMGLLSDGGVHSHINHIKEAIRALQGEGREIFFHAFMDGRDTARDIGHTFIEELQKEEGFHFASMQGRSIGMDRDRRWEKIEKAYKTMTGKADITKLSPLEYIKKEYSEGRYDEFLNPTLFDSNYSIKSDDSVFFLNFRPDRAIQMTLAMADPKFSHFKRDVIPSFFLCMTPYVPDEVELPILFDKEPLQGGLSEYLSQKGLKQLKIAETEKYAHVTFFFNGGRKEPYKGEEQILIPSPKEVTTYDQKPEMSAFEVTEKLKENIDQDKFDFYLVNFANSDMVGHTGNYQASIKALETLDQCVKTLIDSAFQKDISVMITADHGNSDQMVYEDESPHTSHTGAPVPFCLLHPSLKNKKDVKIGEKDGALMDVSPTILYVMGLEFPPSFEGKSLFL